MFQDNHNTIPEEYLCPISKEIMTDPVVAADGQTYQRKSITDWLSRGKNTSPLNGLILSSTNVYDNLALKRVIREFQDSIPDDKLDMERKSELVKCIKEREETIKTLFEKIDQINSQVNISNDYIGDQMLENISLKKRINELEKQIIEKDEIIITIKKEYSELNSQINAQ